MIAAGKRYILHPSRSDELTIWNIADAHEGSRATAEEMIDRDVKRIADDPNAFWFGGGDNCLPMDAEILTKRGFLKHGEVTLDDMTLGYKDGTLGWVPILRTVRNPMSKLVELKSQTFLMQCTPDHKWVTSNIHKRSAKEASRPNQLLETRSLKTQHRIVCAAPFKGQAEIVLSVDEARLLAWVVTDGSERVGRSLSVNIAQKKEPYKTQIRTDFAGWFTAEYRSPDNMSVFNVKIGRYRELCARIGVEPGTLHRSFPGLVTRIGQAQRRAMYDTMLQAEGWQENGRWRFSQKPGPILDAFMIVAAMLGIRLGPGGLNNSGVHVVRPMLRGQSATVADMRITALPDAATWCCTTTTGTFVARLGTQVSITGNCEFITYLDRKRFDPSTHAEYIKVADLADIGMVLARKFVERMRPIKSKCLGLVCGNHEDSYKRDTTSNIHAWVCGELGAVDLSSLGFIDLCFVRQPSCKVVRLLPRGAQRIEQSKSTSTSFRILAAHGAGAAQTVGGKIRRLDQYMTDFEADLYFMGHVHGKTGHRKVRICANADCTKIIAKDTLGVISGSYLKSYQQGCSTYSERRGYSPSVLGAAWVRVNPETREMRAEI